MIKRLWKVRPKCRRSDINARRLGSDPFHASDPAKVCQATHRERPASPSNPLVGRFEPGMSSQCSLCSLVTVQCPPLDIRQGFIRYPCSCVLCVSSARSIIEPSARARLTPDNEIQSFTASCMYNLHPISNVSKSASTFLVSTPWKPPQESPALPVFPDRGEVSGSGKAN